jgi:type VI secretion system protein ImpK
VVDRRSDPGRRPRPERSSRPGRERGNILETLVLQGGARRRPAAAPERAQARLVDLAAEWLSLIATLRLGEGATDPAVLRGRVLDHHARFAQRAQAAGFAADDIATTQYALIAFVDESVRRVAGAARDAWNIESLQKKLYGADVAGEEFFERLEQLRRDRERRVDAIEIYYACLALGFRGRYGVAGPEAFRSLMTELERDLAAVRGVTPRPISPHARRSDDAVESATERVPAWIVFAILVPAVVLVWLVILLLARHGAGGTADAIARGLR